MRVDREQALGLGSGRAAIRQICAQPAKNRWSPVIPSMTGDSSSPRAIR
jgi:hypothetical protein